MLVNLMSEYWDDLSVTQMLVRRKGCNYTVRFVAPIPL